LDGLNFANANFETGYTAREGYTVLDSSTGNIFLHMISSTILGAEFGTIFKSNVNGTNFRKSIEQVNQNRNGYVDFEKLSGINGSMIINKITNLEQVSKKDPKNLQSMISFDDGLNWKNLEAPKDDSLGKTYKCTECFLNLHAFTDRHDLQDQFSFNAVAGYLIGVGIIILIRECWNWIDFI
jgi:hypothetical protein